MSKNFLMHLNRKCVTIISIRYNTSLGIIGVPFSKGQTKPGVEKAPDLLRENGLSQLIDNASSGKVIFKDYGNLDYSSEIVPKEVKFGNMKNFHEFLDCSTALIGKVKEILDSNDQFLAIGGDHSIGFGSVAGHLHRTSKLSLVWIDAHADINLHVTSKSGNIHGMPVALLLKELRGFWNNVHLKKIAPYCLPADQIVYIGLRDVEPYEAYILKEFGIRAYAMDAVDKYGVSKIMEMALDSLCPENAIHVSFDIDALDKSEAPSTGTIVHGGLTLREAISIAEILYATNRVQGTDLVEINPLIGSTEDAKKTVSAGLEILKSIYGYKRGGNLEAIESDIFNTKSTIV